jgi:hypothetical protein
MLEFAATADNAIVPSSEFVSGPQFTTNRSAKQWIVKNKFVMNPAQFIGWEFALVDEVERVYVQCEDREFQVSVIVNERDPQVRRKIYAREQALMDELPNADFDFHIIARGNRDLTDTLSDYGKLVYRKNR